MIATILTLLGLNKAWATVIEFVAVGVIVAGVVIYVMALREKAHKYDTLHAQVTALEQKYQCKSDLAVCLAERDTAAANEQARLQKLAVAERSRADELNKKLLLDSQATMEAIEKSTAEDGPLPAIMQQEWDRERAARGVK